MKVQILGEISVRVQYVLDKHLTRFSGATRNPFISAVQLRAIIETTFASRADDRMDECERVRNFEIFMEALWIKLPFLSVQFFALKSTLNLIDITD